MTGTLITISVVYEPEPWRGNAVIQDNLMAFRDYDPVAFPEHFCPFRHPELSQAGIQASQIRTGGRRFL